MHIYYILTVELILYLIFKSFSRNRSPHGVIYKSRTAKTTAPFIASFSSRGPQEISSHILKVGRIDNFWFCFLRQVSCVTCDFYV